MQSLDGVSGANASPLTWRSIEERDDRRAIVERSGSGILHRAISGQQFSFWHLRDFVRVLRLVMSLGGWLTGVRAGVGVVLVQAIGVPPR